MQVRPHIMLQGGVGADAIHLWQQALPGLAASPSPTLPGFWHVSVGDQRFTLFDSPAPHDFGPTPAWSFMVDLDSVDDVDKIAAILSEGGSVMMPADRYDFADRFAWVADRFGISWQLRFGGN